MSTQLKTMAIKARLANYIRKTLYKRKWDDIKVGERDQILQQIYAMNTLMHWELNSYKDKRKEKKAIHEARVARGYKFKKKTSLADFQKIQK